MLRARDANEHTGSFWCNRNSTYSLRPPNLLDELKQNQACDEHQVLLQAGVGTCFRAELDNQRDANH